MDPMYEFLLTAYRGDSVVLRTDLIAGLWATALHHFGHELDKLEDVDQTYDRIVITRRSVPPKKPEPQK